MNENLAFLIARIAATVVNVSHPVFATASKVTCVTQMVDVRQIPYRINVDTVAVITAFVLVTIVVNANQDLNQNQTRVDVYWINDQINHPMGNRINHFMDNQLINQPMDNRLINHHTDDRSINQPVTNTSLFAIYLV